METYWNYRIVKTGDGLTIHQVHYEGGEIVDWSKAVAPIGDNEIEFKFAMEKMLEAFGKPTLDESDFSMPHYDVDSLKKSSPFRTNDPN